MQGEVTGDGASHNGCNGDAIFREVHDATASGCQIVGDGGITDPQFGRVVIGNIEDTASTQRA